MAKVRKFNHGVYLESPVFGQDHIIRVGNQSYGQVIKINENPNEDWANEDEYGRRGTVKVRLFRQNGVRTITANYWSKDIQPLGPIESYVPGLYKLIEKFRPVISIQTRDNWKLDDPNSPMWTRPRKLKGRGLQYV